MDGVNWAYITKLKVIMPTNVHSGLMVTSGSATQLNTSTFDNLLVSYNGGTISRSSGLSSTEFETTENEINKQFSVYPNPSKGILEVRLPVSNEKQSISIFDINGREIVKETVASNYKQFNLSHLSNGIYYIRYREGVKVKYQKFIINK